MVNLVWLVLIIGGLVMSAVHGTMLSVTEAIMTSSEKAVEIAFGFIGIMTLWLGMARIAEESGMMRALSRIMAPLVSRLFPGIPKEHPAMGNMLMNMSANILGMGGAATPFGLKAMEELQKLNTVKDRASANMITFLAVNTASINLIPATVIALRVAAGSHNPTEIVGPTILATTISSIVAVSVDRFLRYWHKDSNPNG